jgi:hypothetical protein
MMVLIKNLEIITGKVIQTELAIKKFMELVKKEFIIYMFK